MVKGFCKRKKYKGMMRLIPNALLLLIVFFLMIPFIWMITISLRNPMDAYRLPFTIFPDSFDLSSYLALRESKANIPNLYMNSLISSAAIVLAQLVTCPLAGYAFARLRFKGRTLLFNLFLISLMIPRQSIIIPMYVVMSRLKLTNTLLSLILPSVCNAFGVFLFRQSFAAISRSYEDAAYIDGAGIFRAYWQIMLPQVKPTLVTLIILTFTSAWNMYFEPLIFLTNIEKMTLPLGLVYLKGYMGAGNLSVVMAAVALAIVPVVIIFFLCQSYIVEGLTSGGIKE
ncbi:MAG: carbohydrate ABC transporter permease [Clostridia bacterium]|nr:carbohydrate ABC transporter permease [Clostridia bacterium]